MFQTPGTGFDVSYAATAFVALGNNIEGQGVYAKTDVANNSNFWEILANMSVAPTAFGADSQAFFIFNCLQFRQGYCGEYVSNRNPQQPVLYFGIPKNYANGVR